MAIFGQFILTRGLFHSGLSKSSLQSYSILSQLVQIQTFLETNHGCSIGDVQGLQWPSWIFCSISDPQKTILCTSLPGGPALVRGNVFEHLLLPCSPPTHLSGPFAFYRASIVSTSSWSGHLPPMGSALLGVHRITLIHDFLASLHDSLVLFLPHPSPYRKLQNACQILRRKGKEPSSAWCPAPNSLIPLFFTPAHSLKLVSKLQLILSTRTA